MISKLPALASLADEAVDIAIATVTLLAFVRLLRRSPARLALVGVALIGFIDLAARQFGLPLTAWLFQGIFLIAVVVLLLAFQDDLKRLFERLALWGLRRQLHAPPADEALDVLVDASAALAVQRHGALIVLPGREPIQQHLTGGVVLNGALSKPLLLSLFDPHSPGHDGATVVEGGLVRRFGAHLPLSADLAQLAGVGTRHAAALGLSEHCDAFVIVVSEERGTISSAHGGRLRSARDPEELRERLRALNDDLRPRSQTRRAGRWGSRTAEWGIALAAALLLWMLVVFGGEPDARIVSARVSLANLPAGYMLRALAPPELRVTVSGPRRSLFFMQSADVVATVDALSAQLGRREFDVTPQSVRVPAGVTVQSVDPGHVTLDLQPAAPAR